MNRVLVTGISGFLGGHVALALLRHGYAVRGSLRDLSGTDRVRATLATAGADVSKLDFCALDLLDDRGWTEAVAGCRFMQHIASPFVLTMPKQEEELIRPAVEGTHRAVRAGLEGGLERIVVTSSLAAIDGGHRSYENVLDTQTWTNIDGPFVTAYAKSKKLAECEAWATARASGVPDRIAVIDPGTLLGPLLDNDPGTSATIVQRLMSGEMPMIPDLVLPFVDVRDVADAHVEAMTAPHAAGHRHILSNPPESLIDIARMMREDLGEKALRVPTWRLPSFMASILGLFDQSLRDSRTYLGVRRRYDMSSGEKLLGRPLGSTRQALLATAHSLIERQLVAID